MEQEGCSRICNCIEELLSLMVATEALEHNAVIGERFRQLGAELKRTMPQGEYQELVLDLDWLERPITEGMADLTGRIALREVQEKCNVDVSELKRLLNEGIKLNEKKLGWHAQAKFMDVKLKASEIALKLCNKEKRL